MGRGWGRMKRCDWRILACHFFVWFVHGLELLQQGGGGDDAGRPWKQHTHTESDLHAWRETDGKCVFSSFGECLLRMRAASHVKKQTKNIYINLAGVLKSCLINQRD